MVNKHQFQLLAKSFRAGKISLSEFTEQAFNPPSEPASSQQTQSSKSEPSNANSATE